MNFRSYLDDVSAYDAGHYYNNCVVAFRVDGKYVAGTMQLIYDDVSSMPIKTLIKKGYDSKSHTLSLFTGHARITFDFKTLLEWLRTEKLILKAEFAQLGMIQIKDDVGYAQRIPTRSMIKGLMLGKTFKIINLTEGVRKALELPILAENKMYDALYYPEYWTLTDAISDLLQGNTLGRALSRNFSILMSPMDNENLALYYKTKELTTVSHTCTPAFKEIKKSYQKLFELEVSR